mmetsp:Transcript_14797/g.61637  ORF Transcript_14797/g.61637 Transcript_14797/m.61637 type:complete len:386 (-) Transcript_14797:373-1530(-)
MHSTSSMTSSGSSSAAASLLTMAVRRSVPIAPASDAVSSLMMAITRASSARMPESSATVASSSAACSLSLASSSPDSLRRGISSTISACLRLMPRRSSMACVCSALVLSLSSRMISSALTLARTKPCTRCSLRSASPSAWRVRRCTTSNLKSRYARSISRIPMSLGSPSWMAIMFAAKRVSMPVSLYSWCSTRCGSALRLTSTTSRMPSLSLSSRTPDTPSSFLSSASSAMRSASDALLVPYGSSVMTIEWRPRSPFSKAATPRTVKRPLPVRYMARSPPSSTIWPPVGKSGAGRRAMSASTPTSASSMSASSAAATSRRLCGGMLVAMPTAMPWLPLMSRFGSLAGSTAGSSVESSKLGAKGTVSLSRSARSMSAAAGCRRHSV